MLTLGKSDPLAGVSIGDPFMGGYLGPIMDSSQAGAIVSGDAATTPTRYAVILSSKSMEFGAASYRWDSVSSRTIPYQSRWDGLGATQACAAVGGSGYEAFKYVNGLSYPSDGGSQWYIPSIDELDAIFKLFKPTADALYSPGSATTGGTAPVSSQTYGYNPTMDPQWLSGYASGNPAQTGLSLFKTGGAQAMTAFERYRSATEYSATFAWYQYFSGYGAGYQYVNSKTDAFSDYGFRPVRRLVL